MVQETSHSQNLVWFFFLFNLVKVLPFLKFWKWMLEMTNRFIRQKQNKKKTIRIFTTLDLPWIEPIACFLDPVLETLTVTCPFPLLRSRTSLLPWIGTAEVGDVVCREQWIQLQKGKHFSNETYWNGIDWWCYWMLWCHKTTSICKMWTVNNCIWSFTQTTYL